jgi:hypothetical protein
MFYETVFEDGTGSVAEHADDAAAIAAVTEQNERAKTGKKNGPQEATATRVAKVFVYPTHPGDYGTEGGLSSDEVKASVTELLKGKDVIDVQQLAMAVSALNHPMVGDAGVHDSKFKMKEERELELSL